MYNKDEKSTDEFFKERGVARGDVGTKRYPATRTRGAKGFGMGFVGVWGRLGGSGFGLGGFGVFGGGLWGVCGGLEGFGGGVSFLKNLFPRPRVSRAPGAEGQTKMAAWSPFSLQCIDMV